MNNSHPEHHAAGPVTGSHNPPPEPDQLMTQGDVKKYPQRWTTTESANEYLRWLPTAQSVDLAKIKHIVGARDAARRVKELAESEANEPVVTHRRRRLEGIIPFVLLVVRSVRGDLDRLRKTLKKTPRLERYQVGRTELPLGQTFSLAQFGDVAQVVFWAALFSVGCSAEIVVSRFNIIRAEMEGLTAGMAWFMAVMPFLTTFVILKWLDPGDIDRDRHRYYAWLTRAALTVAPVSMYLFSAKLEALIEVDYSDANASQGPAFTWVLLTMQLSFAIAVYMSTLKLADAWHRFLGYDVRKTREYLQLCEDVATTEDSLRSLTEIGDRVQGSIAALDAHVARTVEAYKCCYDQCVKDDERTRRLIQAKADAAAAQARLNAEG